MGTTKWCWIFIVVFIINLNIENGCDAFKLRSNKIATKDRQKYDDEEIDTIFDDENDDDDNDEESIEDLEEDDNDDDDDEPVLKSKVLKASEIFAKVRKARHFSSLKKKLRPHTSGGDTSSEMMAETKSTEGVFSSVLSWFKQKQDTADDDAPAEVVEPIITTTTTKQVVVQKRDDAKKIISDDDVTKTEKKVKSVRKQKGWRAYLEKLPISFLLDFISEGQSNEDDDDEPEVVASEIPASKPPLKPTAQIVEDLKKSVKEKVAEKKVASKKKKVTPALPHEEFERLLMNIPSFVPNYTRIHNFECKMQGEIFERQLKGHKPWTLQMIDSSAKITSGLMRGNMNQLGDYDMCTRIATKVKVTQNDAVNIRGKYCLAHIDVTAFEDGLKGPLHLIQGKGFMKSSLDDPVHFIPRFTTANWGLCVPAACDHEDVEKVLNYFLKPYNGTGLRIQVEVDEENCYIEPQSKNWKKILVKENWEIPATLLFYTFCIVATAVATLNDYSSALKGGGGSLIGNLFGNKKTASDNDDAAAATSGEKNNGLAHRILMSWSLKSSTALLFKSDGSDEEQIGCIHGIKAIGSMLLFAAFRAIPLGRTPFDNRNELTELFNSPLSVVVRALFLYTDLFLFISGLLCSYGVVKDVKSNGKLHIFRRIIGRVIRLVPTLLAVLLFYAYIWEYIGNGPQWGDVVVKNSNICKENMWKNLLFIQNFLPFQDICATHTYQLAIDMQLFLITPIIVWFFYKNPLLGIGIYGILHGFSTGARFTSVADDRLSFVLFHGMKLSQIYRTANKAFSQTIHRASPYMIGIGLGVALRDLEKNIKIPKVVVVLSWLSSIFGIFWCFWSPSHLSSATYQYDANEAAQYAALSSIVFSLSLAWIVFACNYGYGGFMNQILSSNFMTFFSRISYSTYLIQFIVFFTFVGRQRPTEHFSFSAYIDTQEWMVLQVAALALTLLIDLPMQNIRRIIVGIPTISEVVKEEKVEEKQAEDADFVSPWDDKDEDEYVPRKFNKLNTEESTESSRRLSPREYFKADFDENSSPWSSHSNDQSVEYEDDEDIDEEEEESDIEEAEPIVPPKPEPELEPIRPMRRTLASRRWNMDDD